MSRIADKPTIIPKDVSISYESGILTVKGKKGELKQEISNKVFLDIKENELMVLPNENFNIRKSDEKKSTALRGTITSLIRNMILGVTEGFKKELEIIGVGYRAALQGNKLTMNLAYSHPIEITPPEGITIEVPAPNKIIVSGANKYIVGEVASKIRSFRKPNPYSGKGIKYSDEIILRKEGKKV